MKTKKLINRTFGVILLSIILTSTASAAEYPSPTKAKGNGKIEFKDSEPEIIDPVDPEIPVIPEEPGNGNDGELVIQYVSDFNFGSHKKTMVSFTANTYPDSVKTVGETEFRKVPSFISTKDTRVDRKSGWTLSVTSSTFKSIGTEKHEIPGGEVVFTNANYADGVTEDKFKPMISAKATASEIGKGLVLTPDEEVLVAAASSGEQQGIGSYSLAFGSIQNDLVNGVTFRMPEKTSVYSEEYSATFDWELKPEVSAI